MFSFLLANMIQLLKYAKSFPLSLAWFGNGKVACFPLSWVCMVRVWSWCSYSGERMQRPKAQATTGPLLVCSRCVYIRLLNVCELFFSFCFWNSTLTKLSLPPYPFFSCQASIGKHQYCPSQPLLTSLCVVKCAAFYKTMYVYRLPKKNARPHDLKA